MEYCMRLHLNKTLFRQAVQFTAQQLNIPEIYIEKDYWVTFALNTIFNNEIGNDTVFKGGTALSKCFNMIERFSEDIDLVVFRREGESNNKLNAKIKKISDVVSTVLPEVTIEGLTHKMGMNRKTAHSYNKEFQGNYGQVRDAIVLEATWLGYFEPYTTRKINSFVGSMMLNNGQPAITKENELMPFEVRVLDPTRTLCEKIMSLVRFSYGESPIEDLKKKIRHTYDLHQLLQQAEFLDFFNSPAFDEMLLKVANDDIVSFKNNNQWLKYHPIQAIMFRELESIWNDLKSAYNGTFSNLVYGTLPDDKAVYNSLNKIKERISVIAWTIEIENKE
ncbi:nucleotidyl transferase AbiEii/AbiGii toxin family protein [Rhodocytophaga aerolata]|uniref:Nucleotidyl transferase AbiEii/AbiGii toxin family protein n=1 Tax=Rhodocytophaga aerolata TaxID=455078 RepID=A0ABT8RC39_9BACT|nr:nucleotidyl transferase AbiEii/AbiGii toxin family protein [Rhodocytophaga aerolata]MDO1449640.1 nucleotidyl transferase AbiEii/AbiGii toxin family protein [Rhodocytophaga aerolata]